MLFLHLCILCIFAGFTHGMHARKKIVYAAPFRSFAEFDSELEPHINPYGKAYIAHRLGAALEEAGYTLICTTKVPFLSSKQATLISFNQSYIAGMEQIPPEKRILMIWEPPIIRPFLYTPETAILFGTIFVMLDSLVHNNPPYRKLHYVQPHQGMIPDLLPFAQKKFCTLIANNKSCDDPSCLYQARVDAIQFFERIQEPEFDLYGGNWDNYYHWRGTIPHKWPIMRQYKFCICYENMQDQVGYITEKIFDALVSGCIPVYWGASNITDYVPADCFIDRRNFASYEELYAFLKSIDEERYQVYIEAIQRYFASPHAQLFSVNYFIRKILEALSP